MLTLSYQLVAKRKRLGLVCQQDALPLGAIHVDRVHADVSAQEFDSSWHRVARLDRFALTIVALGRGIWDYLTATLASLARRAAKDDLTSREDALLAEEQPELDDALHGSRDECLLACVLRCHEQHAGDRMRIGVLYGAAHVPPVLRLLQDRLGYRVNSADWLTVFEL